MVNTLQQIALFPQQRKKNLSLIVHTAGQHGGSTEISGINDFRAALLSLIGVLIKLGHQLGKVVIFLSTQGHGHNEMRNAR